jgi:hypothetical protein
MSQRFDATKSEFIQEIEGGTQRSENTRGKSLLGGGRSSKKRAAGKSAADPNAERKIWEFKFTVQFVWKETAPAARPETDPNAEKPAVAPGGTVLGAPGAAGAAPAGSANPAEATE